MNEVLGDRTDPNSTLAQKREAGESESESQSEGGAIDMILLSDMSYFMTPSKNAY